jgi:hypothetical protein
MIEKIVSGGQTGVDRAALDAAIDLNFPHGGWCPMGRLAEDGRIDIKYNLKSTPAENYESRTEKNVINSDGTLIVCRYKPNVGTLLTILFCAKHAKPVLWIQPKSRCSKTDLIKTITWIEQNVIKTLNVAGPRASKDKEIYSIAYIFVKKIIQQNTTSLFSQKA